MPEIMAIEEGCFLDDPWSMLEFCCAMQQISFRGMVVEHSGRVVGYVIFQGLVNRFRIVNMAVHPACWKRGVGRFMVHHLLAKIRHGGRYKLTAFVRETNLACQLFLRALGFRAIKIIGGSFPETGEDGYLFLRYADKPKRCRRVRENLIEDTWEHECDR
jgi:ribosomal-protein-alanine N-acetyltransferase